jgi:RecA-family ATPase
MRGFVHARGAVALSLAARGLRVFPLRVNSKKPAIERWEQLATTDPKVIEQYWSQANYNIGVATGKADDDPDGPETVGVDYDCKDGAPGLETLAEHKQKGLVDTLRVRSPSNGQHAYFVRRGGQGIIHNSVRKAAPGVDIRGWHGYLVGPGSVIDGKPYEIIAEAPLAELPGELEQIAISAGGAVPRREAPAEPVGELDTEAALARAQGYLMNDAPLAIEGSRGDETTYRVACRVKDLGVGEGACLELLLEFWNSRCSPPWDGDDLEKKVRNAYRYGQEPPGSANAAEEFAGAVDPEWKPETRAEWQARQPQKPEGSAANIVPFPFINMGNWDDIPVPVQEWDVLGRIPRRQCVLFSGEGGAGKSLVQLHLGAATVLGLDWLGATPRQGPAFFIDCEDDQHVMHYRLAAVARHYGVTFAELVRKGLHLSSLVGRDCVMATAESNGLIAPTKLLRGLLEAARDIKPVIIGIAASANVFAGNENDRSQVQQFVNLLSRLAIASGGSVVLISHPSLTGITSGTGLSGSTQWHNAVRARIVLKAGKEEEPDTRLLEFHKNQYGARQESIGLRWCEGMFLPITPLTDDQVEQNEQEVEQVFLALLKRFTAQNRRAHPYRTSPVYAPKVFEVESDAVSRGLSRDAFEKAMRRLFDKGLIRVDVRGKGHHEVQSLVPVESGVMD